jgi:hypothetical protein
MRRTRKSATAADMIKASALGKHALIALRISRALSTPTKRTPLGLGKFTGPLISVTAWPRRCAARAIVYPNIPLE